MNLAKIRQKARNQKIVEASTAAVPASQLATAEGVNAGVSCFLSEKLPKVDAIETISVPVPVTQQPTFSIPDHHVSYKREADPLKAILAGREAAGCDGIIQPVSVEQLPTETTGNFVEFLTVRIADELYGIDIMRIKEIIKPRPVTEVPRSPVFLPGVISLRGVIIPVIDMLSRLGFIVEADSVNQRIVVIRTGTGFAGLLVDDVIQVLRIDSESIEHAPAVLEDIDREFISGIGRNDNRMIIILNLDNIADINRY